MKNNPSTYIFLCFLVVLLNSCMTTDQSLSESESSVLKKEVLDAFNNFESSLVKGDLETVSKFYSDDNRFYWVENGAIAYPSGEDARNSLNAIYPQLEKLTFKSIDTKVTPINKSTAMLFVKYEQSLVFPDNEPILINGAMTVLLQKIENNWAFIIGHSSG